MKLYKITNSDNSTKWLLELNKECVIKITKKQANIILCNNHYNIEYVNINHISTSIYHLLNP